MTDNFTTHAGNFIGLSSDVDPRTGMFNLTLPLLSLAANNQLGPAAELALSYHPLDPANIGFGNGFALNLTSYDTDSGTLRLSSGEEYHVTETTGQPVILQKKLDNFRLRKASNAWEVVWKNGVTEILHGPASPGALKYPVQILSPTGRRLTLTWDHNASTPRLIRIDDEFRTLLDVQYFGAVSTLITLFPGTPESVSLSLMFSNGNLTRLACLATDGEPLDWTFGYQSVDNYYLLNSCVTPTGLRDEVYYQSGVMRFPEKAQLPALPAVTLHRRYPGAGQSPVETRWHWSDNCYLGFGGAADWEPKNDFTFGIAGPYRYSSTATLVSNDIQLSTTRTYNKFHLQCEEVCRRDGATITTTTTYYADEMTPFSSQPPQFLLPREVSETLTAPDGKTRTTTTRTTFDESGNLLRQQEHSGVITTYSWYPPEGDDGCPPDPAGFTRFMKLKTVSYPETEFGKEPDTSEHFTYSRAGDSDAVLQSSRSVYNGDALLEHTAFTWNTQGGSPEFGRLLATDIIQYAGNSEQQYPSRTAFTTTHREGRLYQTVEFIGHDGLSTITSQVSSALTGLVYEKTDANGIVTFNEYDGLGRLITTTRAAGTPWAATTRWQYHLGDTPTIVQILPDGTEQEVIYNGMGQEISQRIKDIDATQAHFEVMARRYNAVGELTEEISRDWLAAPEESKVMTELRLQSQYDEWGNLASVYGSDNRQLQWENDPVNLTVSSVTRGLSGTRPAVSARRREHFDPNSGLQVRSELLTPDNTPYSTTRSDWDGRGRLRRAVDELGQTTTFTYDALDREVSRTLPDGTTVLRTYAPHLTGDELASISVVTTGDDGGSRIQTLGLRTWDSLGRLTEETVGGRTTRYHYTGASAVPDSVTLPSGSTVHYTYIPELGDVVSSVSADDVHQTFSYDPVTGRLLEAREGEHVLTRTWTPSGKLATETITNRGTPRLMTFSHTLAGQTVTRSDITGQQTKNEYDLHGRLVRITDPELTVSLDYDELGRLSREIATDVKSGSLLTTVLEYDAQGRESVRHILDSTGTILTLRQFWQVNGLLKRRTTEKDGVVQKDEYYTYDNRNRLTGYTVSGSVPVLDAYGHPLSSQNFSYDALNNLTTVTSRLADGSRDVMTYHYQNPDDPAQLSRVTHSHMSYPGSYVLEYDQQGHMIRDEAGRSLEYDGLGRLCRVDNTHYQYDALNRLVRQQITQEKEWELCYRDDQLINEVQDGRVHRLLRDVTGIIGISDSNELTLTGSDHHGSVQWSHGSSEVTGRQHSWSPYGSGDEESGILPGFNGERRDPLSGHYHLGNGYRAYNPALMRFNCPDSMSPFGAGGINAYAYCAGDPVNYTDPSGHFSWNTFFGIVGLLAGVAGGILGFLSMSWSLASWSSIASLVSGVTGVAASLTGMAGMIMQTANYDPVTTSNVLTASFILGAISLISSLYLVKKVSAQIPKSWRRQRVGNRNPEPSVHFSADNIRSERLREELRRNMRNPDYDDFNYSSSSQYGRTAQNNASGNGPRNSHNHNRPFDSDTINTSASEAKRRSSLQGFEQIQERAPEDIINRLIQYRDNLREVFPKGLTDRQYRLLARKIHPDKVTLPKSEDAIKILNAWHKTRRASY